MSLFPGLYDHSLQRNSLEKPMFRKTAIFGHFGQIRPFSVAESGQNCQKAHLQAKTFHMSLCPGLYDHSLQRYSLEKNRWQTDRDGRTPRIYRPPTFGVAMGPNNYSQPYRLWIIQWLAYLYLFDDLFLKVGWCASCTVFCCFHVFSHDESPELRSSHDMVMMSNFEAWALKHVILYRRLYIIGIRITPVSMNILTRVKIAFKFKCTTQSIWLGYHNEH